MNSPLSDNRANVSSDHGLAKKSHLNVGFLGLGRMGAGMAANLLKAGHDVTVYNRTPAKAEALMSLGAKVAQQHRRGLSGRCGHHHAGQ